MPRDYKVYLEDILEAIRKIEQFTASFSSKAFAEDAKTFDAVIRNLEIIGEAVKNVPESVRAKHPQVEWKKIAGLRDMLIHEYFGVDADIVWDVVQNKLPPFKNQIAPLLQA